MPLQKFFRENLAPFKPRRLLRRPYNGPIPLPERIGQPVHQRQFRSHDGQIGLSIFGKRDDCSDVTRLNGHALRFRGDAAIPGGAPDFFHERAVVQFPHQRMFASTAAQHENLHPQSLSNDSLETIDAPSGRVNLAGLDRL